MTYKTKIARHKLIAKLVGDSEYVLDVGYAQHPNKYLKVAWGIDIQETKAKNYINTWKANLNEEDMPYSDKWFDVVIANDIIEHVENPSRLLREINRVLIDGGRLLIGTPNASYYWTTLRNLIFYGYPDTDEGQHLSNWTIMDFKRLLKLNGFKVNKMYGSFIAFPIKYKDEYISVKSENFPRLSQLILYDCVKVGKPSNKVITKKADGYNIKNSKWIEIEQC